MRVAFVAGATGLVGSHLLDLLLAEPAWDRVRAVGRRPPPVDHPRLEPVTVDFERLPEAAEVWRADDVFCCLGTTIKKAGSRTAFERVDRGYVAELARRTRAAGATQFLLVSAISADPRSRNFYSRVKGEAEAAVEAAGFPTLHLFRPSLLMGERDESRPAEAAGILLMRGLGWTLAGPLGRYRGIAPETVAAAMVRAALEGGQGKRVWEYGEMVGP